MRKKWCQCSRRDSGAEKISGVMWGVLFICILMDFFHGLFTIKELCNHLFFVLFFSFSGCQFRLTWEAFCKESHRVSTPPETHSIKLFNKLLHIQFLQRETKCMEILHLKEKAPAFHPLSFSHAHMRPMLTPLLMLSPIKRMNMLTHGKSLASYHWISL